MELGLLALWFGVVSPGLAQEPMPLPMPVPVGPRPPPPPPEPELPPAPVGGDPLPMPEPGPVLLPDGVAPEDVPVIDFLPAPAVQEPEPSPYALSYQGDWWWVPIGPVTVFEPITDVAISEEDPSSYAMVTESGQVWVSPDDGLSWRQVMTGLFEPSAADSASGVQDAVTDVNIDNAADPEFFSNDGDLNDASGQVQQAIDDLQEAAEEVETAQVAQQETRGRVWFDGPVLYASRSDGLHRSEDGGESWSQVFSGPVRAFVVAGPYRLIGTDDGVRRSIDGRFWAEPMDGSRNLSIRALTVTSEGLYAGADEGLYASPDGTFWYPRYTFEEPVLSVTADPDVPSLLWVSLPRTILSSDDNGKRFEEPLTAPMPSVPKMIHLGPLHWIASSLDGPWETMNGGLSWVPIARGLGDPATPGLSAVQGRLLLSGSEGVFRMERAPDLLFDPDAQAQVLRDEMTNWIPRGALIEAAANREGFRGYPSVSRAVQTLLPRVTATGQYRIQDGVQYRSGLGQEFLLDADAGTIRPYDRFWSLRVELRWAPPSRKVRGDFGGADFDASAGADFGLVGDFDNADAASGGDRRTALYRSLLARRVNELYTNRAEALQRRPQVARAPLLQQVQLELYIAELEAELDALTNGAVSAWKLETP